MPGPGTKIRHALRPKQTKNKQTENLDLSPTPLCPLCYGSVTLLSLLQVPGQSSFFYPHRHAVQGGSRMRLWSLCYVFMAPLRCLCVDT